MTVSELFKRYFLDFSAWYTYFAWIGVLIVLLIPFAIWAIKKWDRVKEWKLVKKGLEFLKWIWKECCNWKTFLLLVLVCLILGAPVWVCALLWLWFGWNWAIWVAGGLWAIWMLPGVGFFAWAVAITLGIKKILQAYREGKLHRRESRRMRKAEKRNRRKEKLD